MKTVPESKEKTWYMGPYAGVDYNLTFGQLQHIYHGQAYAKTDLYPMLVSTSSPSQGLWIWPQCDTNALHLLYYVTKQSSSHQQGVQFMFQFTCVSVQAHV